MIRVDLGPGRWADLVPELSHGMRQRIRHARANGLDPEVEGTASMLTGWQLVDVHGAPVPWPAESMTLRGIPSEALDALPAATVDAIVAKAAQIISGQPDPKDIAGPSSGSLPD